MKKLSEYTADQRAQKDRVAQAREETRGSDGLTDLEREYIQRIRTISTQLLEALHVIGGTDPEGEQLASRHLALARNHVEDAMSRVVRHVYDTGMP